MRALSDINAMSEASFVDAFGDVAEHSPWVARGASFARPFKSRDDMVLAFEATMRAASPAAQLSLIRFHPDLATKAKLTHDSSREQQGAGLASLTAEEFAHFTDLNTRYRERFGFPFIFAVKGATKQQILASFEERVNNSKDMEFEMALTQVMRIFRFRIDDRVNA
ncbi:MAG: 2-oxo-4-hydroxy-4-carboxy-5-ureidoimidazoline decarboxylase [Phyllobacteriaceae bacterium]|jgi:2-oxo-4-hydroxy-4-carboxy-5-ureidoimidazoline decarboxylase|nr:2-oxo-4-hydroxy-4-carboxy-5-ureidoimidazoline decarboxylase [Phyllobacteriaceae bacterium]